MTRELPKHGEIWRHFKNRLYEIIECPVIHTETNERMVCYRALYGDYMVYCRASSIYITINHLLKSGYKDTSLTLAFSLVNSQ